MKKIQEFSDTKDCFFDSFSTSIKRIQKLPLPYTGNKKKLLFHICEAINKHQLKFDSVLDAFSGSASVSLLFKLLGKKVLSNDLLTSSYLNAVAFVENSHTKLTNEEIEFLLHNQNENKNTFVEDNYLGKQFTDKETRFSRFTLKECKALDNFRANIDELTGLHKQSLGFCSNSSIVMRLPFGSIDQSEDILKHRIKQESNYGKKSDQPDRRIGIYYDDELNLDFNKWFPKYAQNFMLNDNYQIDEPKIKRATFLANIQQHILRDCMVEGRYHNGQVLAELNTRLSHAKNQNKKSWDNNGSTEMDFLTRYGTTTTDGKPGQGMKWWTFADMDFPGNCLAVNMDIIDLLKTDFCKVDAVYFDPPYGGSSSDYSQLYRFFEEYIYSSKIEDLPHLQNKNKFVSKRSYESSFYSLLENSKHIPIWFFSYNDESWKSIEYISEMIKTFKPNVMVETLTESYRYLYRKNQGRDKRNCEYLIIAT